MAGVKLKNIAEECGVSISTVSRILNGISGKKPGDETSARVFAAAQRLGFISRAERIPLMLSQAARHEAPCAIGCILTSEHETFISPFFSRLLAHIQNEIAVYDGTLQYRFAVANMRDPGFSRFLTADRLDSAIILGRTARDNIEMLKKSIPHIVYAGVNQTGCGIDEVVCDGCEGARTAVAYLASLGHTEIGYIGPTQQTNQVANEHRYEGFTAGLTQAGLSLNTAFVADTILTTAAGYESARMLAGAKTRPTAVFCANDTVALGAMRAFSDAGIRIPADLSIVGFDNIEMASFVKPALTTISVPTDTLAHFAVNILIDNIEHKRSIPVTVQVPFELVVRESCCPIHR